LITSLSPAAASLVRRSDHVWFENVVPLTLIAGSSFTITPAVPLFPRWLH